MGSPVPGGSALMTSAPKSASSRPMNGPAISVPSSRTRTPASGPAGGPGARPAARSCRRVAGRPFTPAESTTALWSRRHHPNRNDGGVPQAQPPPSWPVTADTFSVRDGVDRYRPSLVASQVPLSSPTTDWTLGRLGPLGPLVPWVSLGGTVSSLVPLFRPVTSHTSVTSFDMAWTTGSPEASKPTTVLWRPGRANQSVGVPPARSRRRMVVAAPSGTDWDAVPQAAPPPTSCQKSLPVT